jgi:hypothetical protein
MIMNCGKNNSEIRLTRQLHIAQFKISQLEAKIANLERQLSEKSEWYSTGQPCPRGKVDGDWET